MSLRLRLVAALVVLLAVGIAGYGAVTYRAFADRELAGLDTDIRSAIPALARQLDVAAGRHVDVPVPGPDADGTRPDGESPRPEGAPGGVAGIVQPDVPRGTYAELRDPRGEVLVTRTPTGDDRPDLRDVPIPAAGFEIRTAPGADGDGDRWRVVVERRPDETVLVAAAPMGALDRALRGLLLIEVVGGLGLVVLLGGGAWTILRRGLRPLDRIADTAASITAGSLDQRVPTAPGEPTETRQVATAINGMLDDLSRAFAERQATEAKLRRFVADASHELRTPLTSIQGYAELFRIGADSQHVDTPTILRRVEEEAGRMRHLVEDLLTLARLDEPRPLDVGPVDLSIIAADACSDAAALDASREVTLDVPGPVVVTGQDPALRQAATNLLANALRHTPAGTPVEVATATRDGHGTLTVTDHGPGLSAEGAARAFDRFWQADAARTGHGAGLGLSIVQAVAQAHGGHVTAGNAAHGGATFTLAIPLVEPPDDADPGADPDV
ncbi:sensor histidine kinase [Euzebya sp.]|uniref:sensor histidine kinase n=1 Tax=Euzebya sp. TaxID=1971409 RepID=UPI003517E9B8